MKKKPHKFLLNQSSFYIYCIRERCSHDQTESKKHQPLTSIDTTNSTELFVAKLIDSRKRCLDVYDPDQIAKNNHQHVIFIQF